MSSRRVPPLRASVTACRVDGLAIIGQARGVRAIRRVRVPFSRGRDTRTQKRKTRLGRRVCISGRSREISSFGDRRASPTSPIFASPFGVHRRSAPKVSRFRAGCAATPEASFALDFRRSARSAGLPEPAIPRALAGLAQQRRRPGAVRAAVPQGSCPPLARCAALGSRDAPAGATWRHHRPHRPGGAVRAPIRLSEPSDGPARPVASTRSPRRPVAAAAPSSTRSPGCAISGCWHGSGDAKRRATPRGGSGCGSGPTPTACCRRRNGADTATTTLRRPIRRRWARLSRFPIQ